MTRAIMNGCNGKMGQCITGICAQDEDIEIVAGIDTYDGIKNDYPVFASLKECTVDADRLWRSLLTVRESPRMILTSSVSSMQREK